MKKFFLTALMVAVFSLGAISEDYELIVKIPLESRIIEVWGIKSNSVTSRGGYAWEKRFVLLDENGQSLDMLYAFNQGFYDSDSYIISDDAIAVKVKRSNPHRNCFLYADSSSSKFKEIPCPVFVADGLIVGGYLFYSTEMVLNTVIRVNLKDDSVFEYEGYYPNVDIYPSETGSALAIFFYEGKWHEICEDKIVKSEKKYNPGRKKRIVDYE